MAWTNFTSLGAGPGTTPELDANFLILSGLVNVPCICSGTNTLTLTQSTTTATIPGYLNYLNLNVVASASNTGSVTANFNGFGAVNVYKDLSGGPTLLSGGEIIVACQYTLIYDSALNSNAGGFHLRNSSANLNGQAIVVQSVSATIGSIGSINATNLIAAQSTISNINNTVTMAAMQMGTVTNPLLRLQSTVASFSLVSGNALVPGAEATATISFAGCVVGDNMEIGHPLGPSASLNYIGYVPSSGIAGVRFHNMAVSNTITVSVFTLRFTDIGFVS